MGFLRGRGHSEAGPSRLGFLGYREMGDCQLDGQKCDCLSGVGSALDMHLTPCRQSTNDYFPGEIYCTG
jgi:hypothetical protein